MKFKIKKQTKNCEMYYIVQRKGWIFWSTEATFTGAGGYMWSIPLKFTTALEAEQYISQQDDEARAKRERCAKAKAWLKEPIK